MSADVRFEAARGTPRLRSLLRRGVAGVGMLLGRSLFPLLGVVIIGGTPLWGPWVTLVLALACFGAVSILA